MLEKSIEKRLVETLKARGAMVWKFVSPGRQGVPDRIAMMPGGRIAFIELKTESGRLTPMQETTIREMQKQGLEVYTVYGMKEALALCDYLMPPHAPIPGGKGGDD